MSEREQQEAAARFARPINERRPINELRPIHEPTTRPIAGTGRLAMRSLWICVLLLLMNQSASGADQAASGSEPLPSFSREVVPVLSKAGCNSGGCHGNQKGKGGFLLSLRGESPADDYESLVHSYRGRRLDQLNPNQSLILRKGSGEISHQGGARFSPSSIHYQILKRWIEAGAPPPLPDEPPLVGLQVEPSTGFIQPEIETLQFRVTAKFADAQAAPGKSEAGEVKDVTELAIFETSDPAWKIELDGTMQRAKHGAVHVVVRYMDQQTTIPLFFLPPRESFTWDPPRRVTDIDTEIFWQLEKMQLQPAPLADRSTQIRRLFLSLAGRIPTAEEARSFAALEPQENDYEQWVDRILFSPEFGTYWGMKWGDVLRCDEKVLDDRGVKSFSGWIKQSIHEGKPVDQFVREMITARGSTYENPPANFFRAVRDSNTRGEAVARVFLGYRMQCAQCHNHPFDRWTQNDYYRWASLFSRLDYDVKANQRKDDLDKNEFRGEQFVVLRDKGEVKHPRTGAVMEPSFLNPESIQETISSEDPLLSLSQWLTSRSNKQFARAQVNWVWYQLLGRGLVDPVDDFRLTNPATHPALLESLADQWIEHDFDLRWLVRKIVMSHVFRQASQPRESEHNVSYYSHYLVRRLPAEVLLDAQSQVLGIGLKFDEQPEGTRAIELPGGQREQRYARSDGDKLLFAFGKPARAIACECERSNDLSLSQVFLLMQSESVSKRLSAKQGRANQMARSALSNEEKLAELYWLALSRPPSADESQYALSLKPQGLSEEKWCEQWCQDLLWALLNSQEFVLAH